MTDITLKVQLRAKSAFNLSAMDRGTVLRRAISMASIFLSGSADLTFHSTSGPSCNMEPEIGNWNGQYRLTRKVRIWMMKVKTRKQPFSGWLFSAYYPLTSSFCDKDNVFGLYYEEAVYGRSISKAFSHRWPCFTT